MKSNFIDSEYKEHAVFDTLDRYISFYERLALSVVPWVSIGARGAVGVDSYLYSSIQGTLSSIKLVLLDGRINDAYALLRKYHDSIVINIYSMLYLKKEFSIDNFVVQKIDDWLRGKAKLPRYDQMSNYISKHALDSAIGGVLSDGKRYESLRNRCNDHTHYNFYQYVLLNDNGINVPGRIESLNQLQTDLRDLLTYHLAHLFFVNEHYTMSSDHLDALECGTAPESGSEYWVAPFVQEIFDEEVTQFRPDLAELVKKHTTMDLK